MPNIHNIISRHNKSTLKKTEPKPDDNMKGCNCRNSDECPLENKCLTKSVVYQATVTRQDNMSKETYIGLTENSFKSRYSSHKYTFNHEEFRHATTLSEYIWSLNDKKVKHSIKWKIVSRAHPYSTASKKCNLCTEEKFFIIHKPDMSSLNKRNELAATCRHRKKHLLCLTKLP
jgi:hypothetical protein